jgi:hypothetical protein
MQKSLSEEGPRLPPCEILFFTKCYVEHTFFYSLLQNVTFNTLFVLNITQVNVQLNLAGARTTGQHLRALYVVSVFH